MIEIGQRLKNAREVSGMSIDDIEVITKIRKRYLIALEEGDFSVITEEVYLKGFIKNYAECVGLDGSAIVREYNELCKIRDAMTLVEIKNERNRKNTDVTAKKEEKPNPSILKWVIIMIAVIVLIVILT